MWASTTVAWTVEAQVNAPPRPHVRTRPPTYAQATRARAATRPRRGRRRAQGGDDGDDGRGHGGSGGGGGGGGGDEGNDGYEEGPEKNVAAAVWETVCFLSLAHCLYHVAMVGKNGTAEATAVGYASCSVSALTWNKPQLTGRVGGRVAWTY